jgi:hypothetical protein
MFLNRTESVLFFLYNENSAVGRACRNKIGKESAK